MQNLGYPKDMLDFQARFSNDDACFQYLIKCRWPDGFVCPKCSSNNATLLSSRLLFQCKDCRHQTSATAGTIMHRSKISLQKWFSAAYLVSTFTPGVSALQLKRQLSLSSNDTAWHLLHRLRKGMVNDTRTKLSGLIEADETFIGGPAKGKKGRGVASHANKSLVVGAVEVLVYQDKNDDRCERAGRLRLGLIPDATQESLGLFISENIEPGSRIRTDGWQGYSDAALEDYKHHVRKIKSMRFAHKKLPHIHKVFGNLKTWLNGTHHGVEPKYLPSYLDEFIFRFNRRQNPMVAFQTLLGISVQKSPLSMAKLRSDVLSG